MITALLTITDHHNPKHICKPTLTFQGDSEFEAYLKDMKRMKYSVKQVEVKRELEDWERLMRQSTEWYALV